MKIRALVGAVIVSLAATGVAAAPSWSVGDAGAAPKSCPKLDAGLSWYGDNRERL